MQNASHALVAMAGSSSRHAQSNTTTIAPPAQAQIPPTIFFFLSIFFPNNLSATTAPGFVWTDLCVTQLQARASPAHTSVLQGIVSPCSGPTVHTVRRALQNQNTLSGTTARTATVPIACGSAQSDTSCVMTRVFTKAACTTTTPQFWHVN